MKNKFGNSLIILGLLLICTALILTLYNINESRSAEKAAGETLDSLRQQIDAAEENNLNNKTNNEVPLYERYSQMEMPSINIDGEKYIGILKIPSIGIELPVMSQLSYPSLRIAPCRYKGSVYTNDIIVAGHNYYSHFGSLRAVQPGDEMIFIDSDGNVFNYKAVDIQQIDGTNIKEMTAGEWDFTLFTCNLSGNARVTVRFKRE